MLISFIKGLRHRVYIALFRALPIQKNKIICWSNNLKSYGCSPKYITEYLAHNFPHKYDIVWVFNEETEIPDNLPQGVRAVRYFSIDYLRELHTAKIIITNARIGGALMFHKRRGQFYIQTWHSSLRLKKIEGDAALPESYISNAKKDSANIDLLISGCDFSTEIFNNSFWYNGEILKSGTPRCDMFFEGEGENCSAVREFYDIPSDKRLALYAPTFRKGYEQNDLGLDYASLKLSLEKRFGGEYYILYRFHPNVICGDDAENKPEWLKNTTKYHDMQQLLAVSDILVTDYSSCMFDAAVANKPCFLYVPDLEDYMNNERGLYFDINELPFVIAETNDGLMDKIKKFDSEQYSNGVKAFLREVGSYEDGRASERIAEIIERKCFGN